MLHINNPTFIIKYSTCVNDLSYIPQALGSKYQINQIRIYFPKQVCAYSCGHHTDVKEPAYVTQPSNLVRFQFLSATWLLKYNLMSGTRSRLSEKTHSVYIFNHMDFKINVALPHFLKIKMTCHVCFHLPLLASAPLTRPALIRLWAAAPTSAVALHREDGGGCRDASKQIFLLLL